MPMPMPKHTTKTIRLSRLKLDVQNPRIGGRAKEEREALAALLSGSNLDKIYELAKDIANRGLNPQELLVVMPESEHPRAKYVVLEGNRRLAALRLLEEPERLSKELGIPRLRFAEGRSEYAGSIKEVMCCVYQNREDAYPSIMLKHSGEQKGKGLVAWNSFELARFIARSTGVSSPAFQAYDFVQKGLSRWPQLSNQLFKQIEAGKNFTNFQRVLEFEETRTQLGLQLRGGILESAYPGKVIFKALLRLAADVTSEKGALKVTDIDRVVDAVAYLQGQPRSGNDRRFESPKIAELGEFPDILPTRSPATLPLRDISELDPTEEAPDPADAAEDGSESRHEPESPTTPSQSSPPRPKPAPDVGGSSPDEDRNKRIADKQNGKSLEPAEPRAPQPRRPQRTPHPLAGIACTAKKQRRAFSVYKELQKIDPDTFPNAALVLLRSFIEFSTDIYLNKNNIETERKGLRARLETVINSLCTRGIANDKEKEALKARLLTRDTDVLGMEGLHIFVHNSHAAPLASDVTAALPVFADYLQKVWSGIEE